MCRRFLFLLSFLAISHLVCAEDSLFEPANARTAAPEVRSQLGPESGGIRYDERMIRAAQIAQKRAYKKTTWYCWRYVKDALLAAEVIDTRPTSALAKQAGKELCSRFGFKKLWTRNPYKAPVGAVIVYGGSDAGHVELRTSKGFVSDFTSATAYPRPVIGVYVKPS